MSMNDMGNDCFSLIRCFNSAHCRLRASALQSALMLSVFFCGCKGTEFFAKCAIPRNDDFGIKASVYCGMATALTESPMERSFI